MNKYQKYLDEEHGESKLLNEVLEAVVAEDYSKARTIAARIQAIRDIKWELKKLDENGQ